MYTRLRMSTIAQFLIPLSYWGQLLSANDTIINTSVQGSSDGNIITAFTGGSQPYTYVWSTGDTTSTIDSLAEGLISATITDVCRM